MKLNRMNLRQLIKEALIKEDSDYEIKQQSSAMKKENLPTEFEATKEWVMQTAKEAQEKAQDVKIEHMLSRGVQYDMNSSEFIIHTQDGNKVRIKLSDDSLNLD